MLDLHDAHVITTLLFARQATMHLIEVHQTIADHPADPMTPRIESLIGWWHRIIFAIETHR